MTDRAAEPPPPARPVTLWRHRDFMMLWTAQTVSQFGDEITQLAIPLVAILTLSATPFQIGLLGTFQMLPFILLTIPAGVWVDRMARRPVLVGADIGRAVILTSIPVAFIGGWLTIWQLYAVAFAVGCLEVFFDVAYQSYLPSVVDRDRLVEGNAKLELSASAANFGGPPIAGFLVELLRAPIAILFDALSYLGAVLFLLGIRRREIPPAPHDPATGPRPSMRQEAAEGLRYVLGHRHLRYIAACTGTLNLFGNIGFVILILYFVDVLGLNPGTIGILLAIGNAGVLIGALSAARLARWIGVGRTIVLSALISPLGLGLVAIAPHDFPIPFLVASGIVNSWAAVVYNVNQVSLRQAITPHRMLGRMNATMRFIVWGTIPVGTMVGGILGGAIGLQNALWTGAAGSLVGFLPVALTSVRRIRQMPTGPDEAAGTAAR